MNKQIKQISKSYEPISENSLINKKENNDNSLKSNKFEEIQE
jgi:hypothetical protein